MFDREVRYLAASPGWCRVYGLDADSIAGRSHYEVFPEIPERWKAIHRRGLEGETIRSELDMFVRRDGTTQWLRWSVVPWRREDGEVGGLVFTLEDLTEIRRLAASLDATEVVLKRLFEASSIGIAIADSDARFLRANPAYCAISGYSEPELRSMFLGAVLDAEDAQDEIRAIEQVIDGRKASCQGVRRYVRRDGKAVWIEQVVVSMPSELASAVRILIFARDVTERLSLESRVRRSDRLAAVGLVGAFLGHDMCSALFALRASVDAIGSRPEPGQAMHVAPDRIAELGEGLEHLQQLADGLQSLASDGDGDPSLPRGAEATKLDEWWARKGPLLRRAMPKSIRLEVAFEPGLPPVRFGMHLLTESVLNLLINAGHAIEAHAEPSRRSGCVRVWARRGREEGMVRIGVDDDGAGMSEEVRRRACEPFFTTRKDAGGTGLGLAMVQQLVDSAGGRLDIESAPGVGTTVVMTLPAAET